MSELYLLTFKRIEQYSAEIVVFYRKNKLQIMSLKENDLCLEVHKV